MKRTDVFIKYIGLLLIIASIGLYSCQDDFNPAANAGSGETHICVTLTVQQPGTKASRSVLDPIGDEYELGFTEAEHQIHSLTLIMMQVSANGTEVFEASQTLSVSETDKKEGGYYNLTFDLTGHSGIKHFYVGANMNQKHIGAFTMPDRIFDAGEGENGHNIVGGLMTINHDTDGNGAGSNIVMTGIVTQEGNKDITIDTSNPNIMIGNPIELTRTVAKVLLTCEPTEENADYVKVEDQNSTQNGDGWIKFADVNYMLNVLNRKTFLDYRVDENDNLIDPNYKISDLIEKRESGSEVSYGLKDLATYQKEFLYYDTQAMVEMLNTDVQKHENKTPERCITRTATVYNNSKVGKEATNHYTEGLYCTENMVYKDMEDIPDEDFASVNRFVTTRIMIGAKYTPKKIYINDNGSLSQRVLIGPDDATLNNQVDADDNPGGPVIYLNGTFWRDNNGLYYSLSGMKLKLLQDKDTQFSRYDGGWGYYYTYIDGKANNGTIDYAGETRWGVKRNHYYIIKVEKIIAPGSAFPGNETMRIPSVLIDWVDKGGSETEVKVPQKGEEASQP